MKKNSKLSVPRTVLFNKEKYYDEYTIQEDVVFNQNKYCLKRCGNDSK